MKPQDEQKFSRRERQVMDILYQSGASTVAAILERMADPPSYSAVRALLRTLEEKGHVRHVEDGPRYLYEPVTSRERARESALRHLVDTFFEGSPERAVAALIEGKEGLDAEALSQIVERIQHERQRGR